MRPNIHIEDMVRAYIHILKQPKEKIQGAIYNVGYHNHTVNELGEMVKKVVGSEKPVTLEVIPTNDNRSYHVSSVKIAKELGFEPKFTVENAIEDLLEAFKKKKLSDPLNNPFYCNIKRMKDVELV